MSSLFGSQDQSRLGGKMQSSCGALDFNIIPFKQSDDPDNLVIDEFDLTLNRTNQYQSLLIIGGTHKLIRTPLFGSVFQFDTPTPGLLKNRQVKFNSLVGNIGGVNTPGLAGSVDLNYKVIEFRDDIVSFKLFARSVSPNPTLITLFSPFGYTNTNVPVPGISVMFKMKFTYYTPSGLAMSIEGEVDTRYTNTPGTSGIAVYP